jgi:hypothetical protein
MFVGLRELNFEVVKRFRSNFMPCWTHFGPDLHRRNCRGQIPHAHQIVSGAGKGQDFGESVEFLPWV